MKKKKKKKKTTTKKAHLKNKLQFKEKVTWTIELIETPNEKIRI
jgi:hypothetical protein